MVMEKKGQFFLVAAVIIIVVILGLAGISNRLITKTENTRIYELSKELDLESESVINYGIYNSEDIANLLQNFSTQYGEYIGENSDVYFIYGDYEGIYAAVYQRAEGDISIGGSTVTVETREVDIRRLEYPEDGVIIIIVADQKYQFKLAEGQNFFFVLREITGE